MALTDTQLRTLRRRIGDRHEPHNFSDDELNDAFTEEGENVDCAAIVLLNDWANELSYEEGSFSAQGVSVNGAQMAADKRSQAEMIAIRIGWLVSR